MGRGSKPATDHEAVQLVCNEVSSVVCNLTEKQKGDCWGD